ncbi:hypothetical protein DRO32_05490, partial [Candidatus Bathyarchaeota archaeon]
PKVDLTSAEPDLRALRELGQLEVVRGLSRATGLSGPYAEEVLLRAGIPKDRACSSLTEEELERLSHAISGLLEQITRGKLEPRVVIDGGEWVDVVPVPFLRYSGLEQISFDSMNEAVDAYFTRMEEEEGLRKARQELEREIEKLKKVLKTQEEALSRFKKKSELFYAIGNAIYARLNELNFLLEYLRELREEKGSWELVERELEALRARGPPFSWVIGLDGKGPSLRLRLEGLDVEMDLRASAQENASRYYEEAKKARRKAEGALRALEKTRKKLEKLELEMAELEKAPSEAEVITGPEREAARPEETRARRAWYESFRWFRSSDGILVVAGKDAHTNELLVKRYAGKGDLLIHAEIPGAPFVLIKAGGREVPARTLEEAAQMAIAYSRAWKYGLGQATAICFKPEQAKKIGPHGEKMPKGAFYILGKKEYIRKVKPLIAIGIRRHEDKAELLVGPVGAVSSASEAYVIVGPGDESAGEVLKKALEILGRALGPFSVGRQELERAKALIPYGRGRLVGGPFGGGHDR